VCVFACHCEVVLLLIHVFSGDDGVNVIFNVIPTNPY